MNIQNAIISSEKCIQFASNSLFNILSQMMLPGKDPIGTARNRKCASGTALKAVRTISLAQPLAYSGFATK